MKELGCIIENGELVILDADGKILGILRINKPKDLIHITLDLYREKGKSCDDFTNDSRVIINVLGSFYN